MRRAGRRLLALATFTALAGCSPASRGSERHDPTSSAASTSTPASAPASASPTGDPGPPDARSGSALALLATVRVKGRAPLTGYARAQFGQAWSDDNDDPLGHNGCDTRNDVLRRDLTRVVARPDTRGCVVESGVLSDPYTGRTIRFRRGPVTSQAVQIDHVVALGDAWQTGAQQWDARTRQDLANDPLELLAVDGPANEAKGDSDAASWLPPAHAYRCAYVARQVAVKARYRLWMTPAEHAASEQVLARCPDTRAPQEAGRAHVARGAPSTRAAAPSASTPAAGPVYYPNCAAARSAGAAPLHRGDPGYSPELDRDGDGVACEP